MRILFVSDYPHLPQIKGGLQTTTHDLCRAIRALGAEAAVLCGRDEHGRADAAPGPVADEALGYLTLRAGSPQDALPMVAAAWDASCIVVQSGTALLPNVLASLGTGRPTAVYLHNVEVHQLRGNLVPHASLLYLANSEFTAQRWRALCGLACAVVPPLVHAEDYRVAATGRKVLFVNPTPVKGVELMFALAAACPELPFLVVESWNLEPNFRAWCRQRARALGNIEWRAPTDDMRTVYADAALLLMPSVWEESFGRTVVEAQLNGLPVLASARGALPQLVGGGGLVLDPHQPVEDWASALRRLYAGDGPWAAQARQRGETHAASAPLIVADLMGLLAAHAAR
jgi:glycosyltransferase involved in cell wall biosynthesis